MRRLVPLLAPLFLLIGCTEPRPADPDPTAAEPETPLLVSADDLAAWLDADEAVVLHVARERDHAAAGHVPGARFLPFEAVAVHRGDQVNVLPETEDLQEALRAAGVRQGDRVVVYGDLDGLAATRAFFALDVHGVPVSVLDGGLEAWRAAGRPVATGTPEMPARGDVVLRLDRSRLVSAEDVRARLERPGTVIVDARPPTQHTGEEPGENIERPGHIPGSVNLFWEEDQRPDRTLRPLEELRARYAEAGVTPDRELVTYCRTGVQASHAYFVTRLLGLRPRMYDGSFHDWSNNTDYPVATGT